MKGTSAHTMAGTWSRKVLLALTVVGALVALVLPIAPAGASDNNHAGGKITFCHATNSASNPYVRITTDPASIVKRGHDIHEGPIFATGMVSGDNWGDIIPPFSYSSTATGSGDYAGSNWTAAGQALCLGGGGGGGDEVAVGSVDVAKTTATSLTRTHGWSIDKSVAPNPLKLYIGDTNKIATWDVDVTYLGSTDSGWAVAGEITTTNDGNVPVRIDTVDDGLAGSTVTCGEGVLPKTLQPGQNFSCDYTAPLSSGDAGTNTATVEGEYLFSQAPDGVMSSEDAPLETTGSAEYDFTSPTVTEVNDTVTVTDNHARFLLAYDTEADGVELDADDFTVNEVENFEYTQSFDRSSYPLRGSTCVGETINNRAAVTGDGAVELGYDTASLAVQVQCMVTGSGETATGRGFKWSATGGTSNWFMFTPWLNQSGHNGLEVVQNPSKVDIVAGQHHVIGKVHGTRNGGTTLHFAINNGWELKNVAGNAKVHPMSCNPNKYVQPGGFSVKRNIVSPNLSSFSVSGSGMTNTACYGIHLDVVRVIPDPNF